MRRLALLLALALTTPAPRAALAAPGRPVAYRPPVDGPVTDGFRLPNQPWLAGNRGIDYRVEPGTAVRAAAEGEVVFAGQVGGRLHVVVLHPDGVRTSYSFLRTVTVRRGDRVAQGRPVGTAHETLHFGARVGDVYVDPRLLFVAAPSVHLVPDEARRPASEADERAAMRALGALAGPARAGPGTTESRWAGLLDRWRRLPQGGLPFELRGLWHYARELAPHTRLLRLAATVGEWARQRADCTPADRQPPPLPERRRAVLVGGLGSTSRSAAIDDVDAGALGYSPADVVRFSYRGGTVDEAAYQSSDTTVDLRRSARRLADLLQRLQAREPGVPVDVLAHSQGGLVARQALAVEYDAADPRYPPVVNLVTLGTPHRGADLATALAMFAVSGPGAVTQAALARAGLPSFDPRGPSVRQLAEESRFLRDLARRPLPSGVRNTSIAARGDLVVPARRSRYRGARHVVVGVSGGAADHAALPGSPAAHREMALALAGAPPTCQSLADMLLDAAVSDGISAAEDILGLGLHALGSTGGGHLPAGEPR